MYLYTCILRLALFDKEKTKFADMTELLLNWNKELTKKRDQHGNTPLHFAVSLETGARGMLPQYAVPVVNGTSITSFLNVVETPMDLTMLILEADAC